MNNLAPDKIGILPPGALGVAMAWHLSHHGKFPHRIHFLARPNSPSGRALRDSHTLHLLYNHRNFEFPIPPGQHWSDLVSLWKNGQLPATLLICVNPDQLLEVATLLVALLEAQESHAAPLLIPRVLLCSNGIYFQRIRQVFIEKIEEATLYGRLPDLWPDTMPRLICRLMRGATLQTGLRRGHGRHTVYLPGHPAPTRVAGSSTTEREALCSILSNGIAPVENANGLTPTRIEFDKALVNLTSNLLGLLDCIDSEGRFTAHTVGQVVHPRHAPRIREFTGHILDIGKAVRAFPPHLDPDTVTAHLLHIGEVHSSHIASSIQQIAAQVEEGTLQPLMPPTEDWLLRPLIQYARNNGLEAAATFLSLQRDRLLEAVTRAAHYRA